MNATRRKAAAIAVALATVGCGSQAAQSARAAGSPGASTFHSWTAGLASGIPLRDIILLQRLSLAYEARF